MSVAQEVGTVAREGVGTEERKQNSPNRARDRGREWIVIVKLEEFEK